MRHVAGRTFNSRTLPSAHSSEHPLRVCASTPRTLYVHVPFCREICPFCSFHRLKLDRELAQRYFDALECELDSHLHAGHSYRYLYVGGGTPTILPDRLSRLLEGAYRRWPLESVSVEANPDALEGELLRRLVDSGIHRLSVGVQSFADRHLEAMNRLRKYGTGESIRDRLAAAAGMFETLNIDLIFNLPTQTEEEIRRDARVLRSLPIDQVTWYPLMPSDPTGNRHVAREQAQFSLINRLLADDFSPSSVWCFSRGATMIDEYVIDSHEYAGAGSGAFGFVAGTLYANTFSVVDYCRRVAQSGMPPTAMVRTFSPVERGLYRLLMDFFATFLPVARDDGFYDAVAGFLARLAPLLGAGSIEGGTVRLSLRGRYWLLVLMREFFAGVNALRQTCLAAAHYSGGSAGVGA